MSLADVPSEARFLPDPRSRILAVAGEIFLKEGFAGTTVDAVAAAARMSKESIYDLFPTKSALFEAAVRASIDKHTYDEPDEGPAENVDAFLAHMGLSMFRRFVEPVNFGLFRNNIEAASHFPELASTLHEHRRHASQVNAEHLQPWIDKGCLLTTDAVASVIRFFSLCIGGSRYFLGKPLPSQCERRQLVGRTVSLFLDGYGSVTSDTPPASAPMHPRSHNLTTTVRMSPVRIKEMLDAIKDEFLRHGYRSASIDRAVSVVKVGKTTVYRQFGNKEGVFRHIIERRIAAEAERTYNPAADAATFEDALALLARQTLESHCEDDNIHLQRLLIQESETFSDLARTFYDAKIHALGKVLRAVADRWDAPMPDQAAVEDFYNLATSALRYLTTKDLPSDQERTIDAAEVSRIFVGGVRGANTEPLLP